MVLPAPRNMWGQSHGTTSPVKQVDHPIDADYIPSEGARVKWTECLIAGGLKVPVGFWWAFAVGKPTELSAYPRQEPG
jgi:hypothetical protein